MLDGMKRDAGHWVAALQGAWGFGAAATGDLECEFRPRAVLTAMEITSHIWY